MGDEALGNGSVTKVIPTGMVAQWRFVKDRALANGFDPFIITGGNVIIDHGSGTIWNRTHHAIIFRPDFLEACLFPYGARIVPSVPILKHKRSTLLFRVYHDLCLLDFLEGAEREGREPLAFLAAVVEAIPFTDRKSGDNPYRKL